MRPPRPSFHEAKPVALSDLPEGWLTEDEAANLAELARGKLVLEIGSWLGRSTVAMARTALHVVAVDWHMGSDEHRRMSEHRPNLLSLDTLPEFIANLRERGLREKVSVCVMNSADLERVFRPDSFDFIFVDGSHDLGSAIHDGQTALALVKPQGLVCFHDYDHRWPQVVQAVRWLATKHMLNVEHGNGALAILSP